MARTRQFAIKGWQHDKPLPPRMPKKKTTADNPEIPVNMVLHVDVTNEEQWKVVKLYDEATNNFPQFTLKWKTAHTEEIQALYAAMFHVVELSPENANLLCKRMNDLNLHYSIDFTNCKPIVIWQLVDCFCPQAVIILGNPKGSLELPGDVLLNECFQKVKRILVGNSYTAAPLDLSFLNDEKIEVDIYYPVKCVFEEEPIKRLLKAWIRRQSQISHLVLEFSEELDVSQMLPILLSDTSYNVAWTYNTHGSSLIKNEDIEQLTRFADMHATVVILMQEQSKKEGVLLLDSTGLRFEVDDSATNDKVAGVLYQRRSRLIYKDTDPNT